MKKTLLATAIAGTMAATGAQAATVYDQDGTTLDVYGRIAMGIAGGGSEFNDAGQEIDNGPEFVDVYSRLGLNMSQEITSDLSAFGRLEWRFRGDEAGNNGANDFDAFSETRQSYLGLQSNNWGTVQAGNFDSFYLQSVTAPFDVYIDRGLEFGTHRTQSRGDSIGYFTPDMQGFQVFLQAKHYSNRGDIEGVDQRDDEVVAQGGAKYEVGGLRLAAGFVDDKAILDEDGDRITNPNANGNDEMRYGTTAAYAFTDDFSARLGYEARDDNGEYGGGFEKVGLGMSYAINQWAFNADIYHIDEDDAEDERLSWAAGGYYNVSSNFNLFAEVQQADQPDAQIGSGGVEVDDGDDVYYVTGARYFF
ncbi:porin [Halomonas korlensis]|uniref:Outer membrane protein (Porin) n=1 Tax=Halomonas korlensis TaxID=463301 RepID=A0A1I7HX01_9GAMM|nr:porin [Halomonas korlensis]SFU65151.1 Outer membrane protein (porin) [Halomonas korlensis]